MSASVMNAPAPLLAEDRSSRSRTTAPLAGSSGGTKAPYRSPRLERSRSRPRHTIDAPTRDFALTIAEIVKKRKARAESTGLSTSPGGTLPGAHVELIVDVPVWSNGCFSDLSTLHALRDVTLAHVHGLIAHLSDAHEITAKYRLLASRPLQLGWGSIRLAPSPLDRRPHRRHTARPPLPSSPRATVHNFDTSSPAPQRPVHFNPRASVSSTVSFDEGSYDRQTEVEVELVPGYTEGSDSDEDDDQEPDSLVAAEAKAKGHKEGSVFTMTLNGLHALVMI